ncbi:AAEL014166-PA [Aedes aegypti]|uniref:AAEL014166-PA n=1 Tax=Aedes aegypti TaxID=7159 RepID=Q16H39_AEDAE|nr:AAEL014166-PA [Aedes aegypti]
MGEVIKSCCYCCCTCYQSGLCCASLCCVLLPIIGLLLVLTGIVVAIMLAFSVGNQSSSEYTISRLLTTLTSNSMAISHFVLCFLKTLC